MSLIIENINFVYSTAFRLTSDPDRASDLAQDTLLRACQKIGTLNEPLAVKGWLKRICVNEYLMSERKRKGVTEISLDELAELDDEGRGIQLASGEPSVEDLFIADEEIRNMRNGCFYAMTRRLTLEQRVIFSLTDMFGVGITESAVMLEISESAAKALLHRARNNIYNFFSKRCEWFGNPDICRCSGSVCCTGSNNYCLITALNMLDRWPVKDHYTHIMYS